MTVPQKLYLGDGVFAAVVDGELILTTETGIEVTNRIVLDAEVLDHLLRYVDALRSQST